LKGEYAAIASFSYNEVVPVDGMCFVLSRYFDVETDIAFSKGVCSFAFELMPKDILLLLTRRLWSSVLCNAPKSKMVLV
jgi:hypothetical protein